MTVEAYFDGTSVRPLEPVDLKRAGTLIEDDDLFIGSSALEHSAVLVTNNAKHLGHIKGLKIEVWGK